MHKNSCNTTHSLLLPLFIVLLIFLGIDVMVQYRRTLKRDISGTDKEKRALRSRQQRVCYRHMHCVCFIIVCIIFMQLWERRSRFVTDSDASLWSDVTPPMMSDEEPMPDGKIARRRPSRRSETFNEFMETLDQRANSSLKKSARKERILSTPIDISPPANIKDWMIQRTEDTDISQ